MDKDKLILEMLLDGKSYTDIMAELHVSPQRIIILKKRNKEMFNHLDNRTIRYFNTKDEIKTVKEPTPVLPIIKEVEMPEPPKTETKIEAPPTTTKIETIVSKPSSYSDVGRVPAEKKPNISSGLDILNYYLSFTGSTMKQAEVDRLLKIIETALKDEGLSSILTTALVHIRDVITKRRQQAFSGTMPGAFPKDEIVEKAIKREEAFLRLKEVSKSEEYKSLFDDKL